MENIMTFKQLLKKHGHSYASLAKKLNVTRETPRRWAKLRAIPGRERLEKCAEILGESVETIVASIINS